MKLTESNKLEIQELERANMVINQFVTSCSHSMRGPLKSIKGLVNLLYQSNKYSQVDAMSFLDLIGQSTIKMENMLDELEQILENSKREIILKKIDWNEMIDLVLTRYLKEITEGNIKVETGINQTTEFSSDLHRVHLILSHLIENAIQFQDENKNTHSIHVGVQTDKKKSVIRISDNGIGIIHEVQGFIFNLFFRATQKAKGAGVGLYVVREAVEKMGGTIAVESIPDMGSVFYDYPTQSERLNNQTLQIMAAVHEVKTWLPGPSSKFKGYDRDRLLNGYHLMKVNKIYSLKKILQPFIEYKWCETEKKLTKKGCFPETSLKPFEWVKSYYFGDCMLVSFRTSNN